LRFGDYAPIEHVPQGIFAYTRSVGDDCLLTVLNFTNDTIDVVLPEGLRVTATIVGTHGEPSAAQKLTLAGNEGRLLRVG
jgi:hypothetical protein